MSEQTSVNELRVAILSQAKTIADEYHERAQIAREKIQKESREHLRLREEHEAKVGRNLADKAYARSIQANELKLQRKLDMLRWSLVQSVLDSLKNRFIKFMEEDTEGYIQLMGKWTRHACELLQQKNLVAEVNHRDYLILSDQWEDFTATYVPENVTLTLAKPDCDTLGGIRIRTKDNHVRVDNCFEARMRRLEQQLQQTIMHRLFSTVEQLNQLMRK
jgi:V/A-type H+-transporting ATPase subunit E